ncbi:LysR family transcriptional regulator, partial [Pseudomonas aeruginosa]|nr:LysR family transcriptional regulator [Pseudomonas aeruginosa]
MRRKIPSTAALVSFESAARHESFTKAAEELSLTQSCLLYTSPSPRDMRR